MAFHVLCCAHTLGQSEQCRPDGPGLWTVFSVSIFRTLLSLTCSRRALQAHTANPTLRNEPFQVMRQPFFFLYQNEEELPKLPTLKGNVTLISLGKKDLIMSTYFACSLSSIDAPPKLARSQQPVFTQMLEEASHSWAKPYQGSHQPGLPGPFRGRGILPLRSTRRPSMGLGMSIYTKYLHICTIRLGTHGFSRT